MGRLQLAAIVPSGTEGYRTAEVTLGGVDTREISSATFDLKKGVLVLGWIILIHLFEANLFNPKIMGNAAKIHPVLVVFALIAGKQDLDLYRAS